MEEPALSNLSDGKATWCGLLCLVSQRSVLDVAGQACILQVQLLRREALLEVDGRCVALPWFAGAELSRPCKMSSDYHSTWRQALHSISLDYFLMDSDVRPNTHAELNQQLSMKAYSL